MNSYFGFHANNENQRWLPSAIFVDESFFFLRKIRLVIISKGIHVQGYKEMPSLVLDKCNNVKVLSQRSLLAAILVDGRKIKST